MLIRLIIIALLFTACRAGDMACPEPKFVKLNKRPANYRMRMQSRQMSASAHEEREKANQLRSEILQRQTRPVKSIASIEEWDCPKPGTKTVPKAVKENIRKNRKKFDTYYKNRNFPDSTQNASPGGMPK